MLMQKLKKNAIISEMYDFEEVRKTSMKLVGTAFYQFQ